MFIKEEELIHLNINHISTDENILPVIMCTWKRGEGWFVI
jgi:hypothetical protein